MCSHQNLHATGEASTAVVQGEVGKGRRGVRTAAEGTHPWDLPPQTYFLPVIGLVDAEKLKPGDLVVSGARVWAGPQQ